MSDTHSAVWENPTTGRLEASAVADAASASAADMRQDTSAALGPVDNLFSTPIMIASRNSSKARSRSSPALPAASASPSQKRNRAYVFSDDVVNDRRAVRRVDR